MSFLSRTVLPAVQKSVMRGFSSVLFRQMPSSSGRSLTANSGQCSGSSTQQIVRFMNRNARKPKKANHGKRPCSHARRREKMKPGYMKSSRFKPKLFGFF